MKKLMRNLAMFAAGLMALCGTSAMADEVVLSAESNAAWAAGRNSKLAMLEDCLSLAGYEYIRSAQPFAVDPTAEYELSSMFRTPAAQEKNSRFEFGFEPLDANRKIINGYSVRTIAGTETTLAEAAHKGDTVLKVKAQGKWILGQYIAMNAKADFSDLPNADTLQYTRNEVQNGILVLTMKKPLAQDYSAGCAVRDQINNKLWTVNRFQTAPKEWTAFSGRIKGFSKDGRNNSMWWPTTAFARIFLLVPSNAVLEFKNITVKKIVK